MSTLNKMQINNTVCRFCLKLVRRRANVSFINEVMKKMLSLLLIKVDLDLSEHPAVCGICSEVLHEIYLFKSKCLYTEDIISNHIETYSKVSLRDILTEMENTHNIGDDEVVCRLCIKLPLNGSYIALGKTGDGIAFVRDMIQIHLPEMDLSIIGKSIICEVCHVELKKYVSFATNCMDVEEKIKLYCDFQKISGPVDLACVLQSMEDKALDLQNWLNKDLVLKQEDDSVMVKVEKVQNAKDYILKDLLVDSTSASEFYLKIEEIEIKSENDEMSEEMEDSLPTVAPNNSRKRGSLQRKRQIRKSSSKGGKYLSSDDHVARHRERNKRFGCRECSFKTDTKRILLQHMVIHRDKSAVEMHKCKNCEYETKWRTGLNQHVRRMHHNPNAERKYKCYKCPYETDFNSRLRMHNLRHMDKSDVQMYKCENCKYETRYKSSMIRHRLKYRGERKFKCDQCPYETDFKQELFRHNVRHKDKFEVEMYKCANCEYETKWKFNLIRHMVKHRDPKAEKNFKCDKCPYESDTKSCLCMHNLRRHKNKSEVEMHKCENCEYETQWKLSLIQHMAKHRDPKTKRIFKCDKCLYQTEVKSNLRRHIIKHTKGFYQILLEHAYSVQSTFPGFNC